MNVRLISPLLVAILATAGAGTFAYGQAKTKPKDPVKPPNAASALRDLFQELDTNGDRSVSPDEVTDGGHDAFQTLLKFGDKDKDGKLTAEEYRGLLQSSARAVPAAANPEQRKKRFAKLDANGDGKLDGNEIPGGAARIPQLDRDGDEIVSQEEFLSVTPNRPAKAAGPKPQAKKAEARAKKAEARAKQPEADEKEAEARAKQPEADEKKAEAQAKKPVGLGTAKRPLLRRLKAMDKDGDNRVSREEFQGSPRVFGRLDTNDDGFVDRADRRGQGRAGVVPGEPKPGKNPKTS